MQDTLSMQIFFAVFTYRSTWNWNSLPKSYLESPYLSTDVNALVHASLLSDSVVEQTDMATDEQANSLTNDVQASSLTDNEQTCPLMDKCWISQLVP